MKAITIVSTVIFAIPVWILLGYCLYGCALLLKACIIDTPVAWFRQRWSRKPTSPVDRDVENGQAMFYVMAIRAAAASGDQLEEGSDESPPQKAVPGEAAGRG